MKMKLPKWLWNKGHFHYVEAGIPNENIGQWRWEVRKVKFLYILTFQIYYRDFWVSSFDSEVWAQTKAEYYRIQGKEPRCFSNPEEDIFNSSQWPGLYPIVLKSLGGREIK